MMAVCGHSWVQCTEKYDHETRVNPTRCWKCGILKDDFDTAELRQRLGLRAAEAAKHLLMKEISDMTQHRKDDDEAVYPAINVMRGLNKAPRKEDPWKHRSAGMTCSTCMWFVEKVTQPQPGTFSEVTGEGDFPHTEIKATVTKDHGFGRCRRHAPTVQGYPTVFGNDWCGDHKLDENKR